MSLVDRREALRIAGKQVGIGQNVLASHDRLVELFDPRGQQFVVALVLVAELGARGGRGRALLGRLTNALGACRLGRGAFAALRDPVLVTAGHHVDRPAAVQPQRQRDSAVEEIAIVADDQHGTFIIRDHFLQQVECLEIEIVGRLVEHQQVRCLGEFARQQQPAALATRQHAHLRIDDCRIEQEILEIALDVLAHPAHVDPVAPLGQHLPDALVGRHHAALLVDHHAGQFFRDLDRAGVGGQFAGQQLEQCGLARAVGADHADPVAALDAERKIANDPPLAKALGYLVGDNHRLALEVRLGCQLQLGRALRVDHRRTLGAHLPQLFQPALVALAPRGDSAFQPVRLELEPGVEPLGGARFLGVDLAFPCLVAAEAHFLAPQRPAIEPQRRAGQALQERAVVTDHHERAGVPAQPVLQPLDRGEIEVVGRLVHQQQIGVLRKRAGDACPTPLAAAGACRRGRHVDPELAGDRLDLVHRRGMGARQRPVHQGGEAGEVGLLLERDDPCARLDLAQAPVGIDAGVDQAEQRGLADAVTADQRQPVAGADVQVEAVPPTIAVGAAEQPAAALLQAKAFPAEDRGLRHDARALATVTGRNKAVHRRVIPVTPPFVAN